MTIPVKTLMTIPAHVLMTMPAKVLKTIPAKVLMMMIYKARDAHKRLYTVLPKYSKIQVLPGITSCRLVKDNKQAIELNNLLFK